MERPPQGPSVSPAVDGEGDADQADQFHDQMCGAEHPEEGSESSTARARLEYPHADRVHPEFLGIMTRLEREGDPSREGTPYQRIRNPDSDLGILYGPNLSELWMTSYHSGAPDRVIPIPDADALKTQFAEAPPGTNFLVRKPRPEIGVPEHVKLVNEMRFYELWEVGDPSP